MGNKAFLYTPLVLLLFLGSCKFQSYSDYSITPYDGEISWELIEENPDFSNRRDHAAVSFDGQLWVLGGYDQGGLADDSYLEDVWSSPDGKTWTRVLDDAPWKGRRGHEVVAFNGYMYLYGGFQVDEDTGTREYRQDIWKSDDGASWTMVKDDALWDARFEHKVIPATHSGGTPCLYLVGGSQMRDSGDAKYAMVYYNDVWRSEDGETWDPVIPSSGDYGGRSSLSAAFDPTLERLYLNGGLHTVMFDDAADGEYNGTPTLNWNSLWYTDDDGDTWEYADQPAERADHQMVFLDNRLWLLPGRNNSAEHYYFAYEPPTFDERFYSTHYFDGSIWVEDSLGSGVGARHGYASVIHDGKMWIIGGMTADDGPDNDVWCGEI